MMLYRLLSTPTMTTTVPLAPPKVDLISTARSEESAVQPKVLNSGEQIDHGQPRCPREAPAAGKSHFEQL